MLVGKRALITGSSQGIGRAIGQAFLEAGAAVVLTSEHPLAAVILPAKAHYRQADLREDAAIATLIDEAWQQLGGIDILVNNVGTFAEPPFAEITRNDFDRIFRLNLWSALHASQCFVRRATQEGHGGRILFSTSLNATRSEPGHTLYDASKGAVSALVRQLAIELAPLGFTTAAVAPGLVETPLTDFGLRSDPAARQQILEQIPLRRIATVEDIAGWYVFLASDRASYATGATFIVDGGLDAQQMAQRPITEIERRGG